MRVLVASVLAIVAMSAVARAELIERVMAVVDGALILQSDVTAARRFGLVPQAGENASSEALLDRLIERRLMLTEVNRYAPAEPAAVLIERRVGDVRARFASSERFEAVLAETGFALDELARHVRDDLRIESYLRQRFGSAVQPSEAEILQYYRDRQEMFTRGGVVLPYGEVHEDVRTALIEERRSAAIRGWVEQLRRRANVSVPGIVPVK